MDMPAHLDLWRVRALETPQVQINAIELSGQAAVISSSSRTDSGIPLWCVRSVDWRSLQLVLDASQYRIIGSLAGGSVHCRLLNVESTQGRRYGSVYDLPIPAGVRVDDCQSNGRHAHRTGASTPSRLVEPTELRSARSHSLESRAMVRVRSSCWSGVRLARLPLAHLSILGVRATGCPGVGIGTSGTMDLEQDWLR